MIPISENSNGPSTQYSYTCPRPVLQLLLPKVPNYWVLGRFGQHLSGSPPDADAGKMHNASAA